MTFYKVRRAMMSVLHVARDDVRPSTELGTLVPNHRRRVWRALQAASGFRMPKLQRSIWVVRAAACLTVAMAVATPLVLHIRLGHGATALAIGAAIVYGYLFVWLTMPLAFAIPPEYATIGLFVRAVMARNYWAIAQEAEQHANDAEAWDILRRIIGEQLRIRADQITKETRFRDFNID